MTDWKGAACVGKYRLFFDEKPAQVEKCRAICAGCPISRRCLDYALEHREAWGVWGGMDYAQLKDEAALRGMTPPNRKEIEHGTERGWAWHRRQRAKDPNHQTCQDCTNAYNYATKIRVQRYRERLLKKGLNNDGRTGQHPSI